MRVWILVKTYPTLSTKYGELVCTAGINENGEWIRIYPLPFRKLEYESQYKKFQWIKIDLKKNTEDFRPESFRPVAPLQVLTQEKVESWDERRHILFRSTPVYDDLGKIIALAHENKLSLAIFKPSAIIDFKVEQTEREWSQDKLDALSAKGDQLNFFQTPEELKKEFSAVPKVPYKFSYTFCDKSGQKSTLMIEDWEIGMLYWNCLKSSNGNELEATEKVRQKYFVEILKRDVYLFLGTTKEFHLRSKNPFVIIGVFWPPHHSQKLLFDIF
ncbi:MAG: hypothetical protein ACRCUY_06655 [Thermoguttaceae bacterium]